MTSIRRFAPALAVVAAVGVAAPAVAVTTVNVDVWSGKTKSHKQALTISNDRKSVIGQVQLYVTCKGADGNDTSVEFAGQAKIKNGKLKFTKSKATGTAGTLTISAKVPRTKAATGTIKWTAPDSTGTGCTGHDTFKLKHVLSHGG